jgi:hypothetical protein
VPKVVERVLLLDSPTVVPVCLCSFRRRSARRRLVRHSKNPITHNGIVARL